MRVLLVALLFVSVAGCVSEDDEDQDPLFGVCPQWVEGPQRVERTLNVTGVQTLLVLPTLENSTPALEFDGFALDLYAVRVDSDAPVEVRAWTEDHGRRHGIRLAAEQEPDTRIAWRIEAPTELAVYLTPVAHGTPAEPGGILLEFNATAPATVHVEATPWYRVCGAVVPPAETR